MSMTNINDVVGNYAPWRKGIAWWVVALQAAFALGLGIWSLWDEALAPRIVVVGFSIYYVFSALRTVWAALRGRDIGFSVLGLLAAGGGLVIGTAVLVPTVRNWIGGEDAYSLGAATILYAFGIAQVIIGLLSIGSAFVEKPEQGVRWVSVLRGAIILVLGIWILYALNNLTSFQDSLVIQVIGWALVVIGVLLGVQAFMLYRGSRPAKPATPPTTPAAPAA